jgi:excisionase family DNA binding protein
MDLITVKEASQISGTQVQSLYVAIKKGRLKAKRKEFSQRFELARSDLENYLDKKYDRTDSKFEGKLRWDKKKGEFSVSEAANFLGVPTNLLYYFIRSRKMAYMKKGSSYVLHMEELLRVKTNLIDK